MRSAHGLHCPRRGLWLIVVTTTALAGCGDGRPERVPVAGVVTIDGTPLNRGFITFVPEQGRSSSGDIDAQGRFELFSYKPGDGVLLGNHKVEVVAIETISDTKMRWLVPKKYANRDSSGLTCEVDGPRDDVEIELSWDGGKPLVETNM